MPPLIKGYAQALACPVCRGPRMMVRIADKVAPMCLPCIVSKTNDLMSPELKAQWEADCNALPPLRNTPDFRTGSIQRIQAEGVWIKWPGIEEVHYSLQEVPEGVRQASVGQTVRTELRKDEQGRVSFHNTKIGRAHRPNSEITDEEIRQVARDLNDAPTGTWPKVRP